MSSEPNPVGVELMPSEVISTFIDGEPVEPELLKRALETPEGRDCLVDLLRIRDVLGRMGPRTTAIRQVHPIWKIVRGPAAAAIVLLALAGGYVAGQRARPAESDAGPQMVVVTSAPTAPKPTRVIKLEPGVNWSDSTGGK
jgi:hypothetical protein